MNAQVVLDERQSMSTVQTVNGPRLVSCANAYSPFAPALDSDEDAIASASAAASPASATSAAARRPQCRS
jgi:hypothetical protein